MDSSPDGYEAAACAPRARPFDRLRVAMNPAPAYEWAQDRASLRTLRGQA